MIEVLRQENKFLVNTEQIARLKKRLPSVMTLDAHGGQDGYTVRSLYFDSLEDRDYHDKLDGLDCRKKIRLRTYDRAHSVIKLELKEKENGLQRKRSLLMGREETKAMLAGDYRCLLKRQEPLAMELYALMTAGCYLPRCIVEYERLAFIHPANDIRVTLDSNLRATESNLNIFARCLPTYPVQSRSTATLEVKFNGFLFSYIKALLNMTDPLSVSNSKYCRARMISKKG